MSNLKTQLFAVALGATFVVPMALAPATAAASPQSLQKQSQKRQKTKNTWRNVATAAAAIGAYGFIKGDNKLGILGAAGAAYSANRYEQDRKGQRRIDDRRRAAARSPHYVTRYKTKNGKRVAYRVRLH